MPLGLGGMPNLGLPEEQRTAVIDQAARNGYSGGIGLADSAAAPAQPQASPAAVPSGAMGAAGAESTPADPAADPAAGGAPQQPISREEPIVDFRKNPMMAIGLVLSSIAAGARGDESPVSGLMKTRAEERKAKLAEEAQRFQTIGLGIEAAEAGMKFALNAPPDQREAVIDHFSEQYAEALPGVDLGGLIRAGVDGQIENAQAILPLLKELGSPVIVERFAELASSNPQAANEMGKALLGAFGSKLGADKKPGEIEEDAEAAARGERSGNPPKTAQQLGEEAEAIAAGTARGKASVEGPDTSKAVAQENTLRGEFGRASQNFVAVRDGFQKVKSAASRKTGAGAIALVFGFMKMLDPGSTVREGEAATVEQARGVPTGLLNLYNRLVSGDTLPDKQRADILETAKQTYADASKNQKKLVGEYERTAKGSGARSENVIIDFFDETLEDSDVIKYDAKGNRL